MAKGKRSGAGHKARSTAYKSENRWKKNRIKKLERALKRSPGNAEQIKLAMANIVYRRRVPENRIWSAELRQLAQLLKQFQGVASPGITSSNRETYEAALATRRERDPKLLPQGRVDFSLAARAMG
jgi:hypothetical protein